MNLLMNFLFFLLCTVFLLREGTSNSFFSNVLTSIKDHNLVQMVDTILKVFPKGKLRENTMIAERNLRENEEVVQQLTSVKRNLRENKTVDEKTMAVKRNLRENEEVIHQPISVKRNLRENRIDDYVHSPNEETIIVIDVSRNQSVYIKNTDITSCIRFYYSNVISTQNNSTFKEYVEYWFGYYSSVQDICDAMMKRHTM